MLQNDKWRYCICIVYCGTCDVIRKTAQYVSGTLFICIELCVYLYLIMKTVNK
jgi:hypothetical protein